MRAIGMVALGNSRSHPSSQKKCSAHGKKPWVSWRKGINVRCVWRAAQFGALVGILCAVSFAHGQAFQPFQPLPPMPPASPDNVANAAKIELGKQLFFDRRLSSNLSQSCLTCHNILGNGSDDRPLIAGAGGKTSSRSPPSLWNAGFYTAYFRDGRAANLESAIHMHLQAPEAMDMKDERVSSRLQSIPGYLAQFRFAFGSDRVTSEAVSKAIAVYLRTLNTQDSAWDRYLRGDASAINVSAKKGFEQFVDIGCASCHFWVNLAGPVPGLAFEMGEGFYELFPNYKGSVYEQKYRLTEDIGRIQITHEPTDRHMWRVSGLRNVAVTAPYFHNGSVNTLSEAVRVMGKTQLNKELLPAQIDDIVAFLHTLTGAFPPQTVPSLPMTFDQATVVTP